MNQHAASLAINGGPAVRTRLWPCWPRPSGDALVDVLGGLLSSGDWSLTGHTGRTEPKEMLFASRFANFYGANWCVPTSSGSTAIMTVLLAIGLKPGDEVLMPGNAWVACAAAVFVMNGRPVLVDIDLRTDCMCCEDLEQKISSRSRAILLVHQNGAIANARRAREIADRFGLVLIEDCSHAHGAFVGGLRVGRIGHASIFSMQKTKLLSSGEGGAIITDDRRLYEKMARARASGRLHSFNPTSERLEVDEASDIVGANFVLSEFQAAILLDRLGDLDGENLTRNDNAVALATLIGERGLVQARIETLADSKRVFHKFVISLGGDLLERRPLSWYCASLTAELGLAVSTLHVPLNRNSLLTSMQEAGGVSSDGRVTGNRVLARLQPRYELAFRRSLSFRHYALLGTADDMRDISDALEKVVGVVGAS